MFHAHMTAAEIRCAADVLRDPDFDFALMRADDSGIDG